MAEQRDGVYVWVTWLSKVMVGEQRCEWASWFKAHFTNYDKVPGDFDLAKWTIDHTRQSRQLHRELENAGEKVFIEEQNAFRHHASGNVIVAGKPDLVAASPRGNTVYDVKTGKERASDQVQVMIYMYLLPLSVARYAGTTPSGCVVYNDKRVPIPAAAIDQGFVKNVQHFLDIISSNVPAIRVPSKHDCRFCDIPKSECPDRIDG